MLQEVQMFQSFETFEDFMLRRAAGKENPCDIVFGISRLPNQKRAYRHEILDRECEIVRIFLRVRTCEQLRVRRVPLRQELAHLATVLARAEHVHVQRAVADLVIEIDRIGISVARMGAKINVSKIHHHLLTNVSEVENERIDILIAVG